MTLPGHATGLGKAGQECPNSLTELSTALANLTTSTNPGRADDGTKSNENTAEIETGEEVITVEINYPRGINLALVTVALCLAIFLVGLDRTILATAIPKITSDFHSLDDIGWYGSSYLLTTCSFQLLFGKLYGHASVKWTFLLAIIIFEVGSLVCGTAPNSSALIVGRAIAGLGCAGIFSGALVIIALSVPLRKRPVYTGGIGGMFGIASVVGPLLGGAFTEYASWRWCFYVNLPLGGVTLLIIGVLFKDPTDPKVLNTSFRQKLAQFDLLGTFLFLPAIVSLLLALQWGGGVYKWGNWRIILLLSIFGVLIVGWISVQIMKGDIATIPLRIISQRSVAFGVWNTFSLSAAYLLITYYLPVWLQSIKGKTATQSGIDYLPMAISSSLSSVAAGGITTKIGYYMPLVILSSVVASVGGGFITTLKVDTQSANWIGYQILFGAGVGLGLQQPLMAMQTVLKKGADMSIGIAMVAFAQSAGGAIFIAVGQSIFANKLLSELHNHAPAIDPAAIVANGASGLIQFVQRIDPKYVPGVLLAYNNALVQTFRICLIMACLTVAGAVGMEWRSIKEKRAV